MDENIPYVHGLILFSVMNNPCSFLKKIRPAYLLAPNSFILTKQEKKNELYFTENLLSILPVAHMQSYFTEKESSKL